MAVSTANSALYRANAASSVLAAYPQTGTAQNLDLIHIVNNAGGAKLAVVDYTGTVTGGAINDVLTSVSVSSFAITAVAFSTGVNTLTGVFTGATSAWVGLKIVLLGFANAGNNGTFVISTANTTTITLANASGVTEGTATATGSVYTISTATYHGTITGSPAAGQLVSVTGFVTNAINNITNGVLTSSSGSTLVLPYAGQVAETHTASANVQSAALSPTKGVRIGRFNTNLGVTATVAQLFQSAFFPAAQGALAISAGASPDILWIVNEGGNVSYYLDAAGVAHGS